MRKIFIDFVVASLIIVSVVVVDDYMKASADIIFFEKYSKNFIIRCGDSNNDGIVLEEEKTNFLKKFLQKNNFRLYQGKFYYRDGVPVKCNELEKIFRNYKETECPF